MTEDEVNDYLASDKVQLPQGVKKVTLQGRSGVVDGFVNVDFDEIRGGRRSSKSLLSLFSGPHLFHLGGQGAGSGGPGKSPRLYVAHYGIYAPLVARPCFSSKYLT